MCASQHHAESGTKDIPRLRQPSEVYVATETHHLIWLPDESQDFHTLTDADSGNVRWCDNMLKTLLRAHQKVAATSTINLVGDSQPRIIVIHPTRALL